MDPVLLRRWELLRRIAAAPGRTEVWDDSRPYSLTGSGHIHPNQTAVVCVEGVVRVERPGRQLDLHPGEVLIVAAGIRHVHAVIRRGSAAIGQGFLPAWSDVVIDSHEGKWFGRVPLQPTRGLLEAAQVGQQPAATAAWLRQLTIGLPEESDYRQPILRPMVELIWRRSVSGVSVEDLVRASGVSRSVAYQVFTRWYGLPPRQAILRYRLTMAEALLAQGLAVAEVSRRCGFGHPDTFARCWRRCHGVAPRSWRART